MSMMGSVSGAFVAALSGSYRYLSRVELWADGRPVDATLDVIDGSVTVTDGQPVRSQVSITVADPDGLLRPTGDDSSLTPYGPELVVWGGIDMAGAPEWVPVGRYPITTVEVDQQWRTYQRRGEAKPKVVPSGTISVQAADRALWVQEAKFTVPQQPATGSTVLAEITRILQTLTRVAPWTAPAGVTDKAVPATVTYSDDRMAALQALADVIDMDPIADPSGTITLQPRTWPVSVWTVAGGDTGVLVSFKRTLERQGVYNYAVVQGADAANGLRPLIGRQAQTDGPLRYRQGLKLPYFQSSPLLTTQGAVNASAVTVLARQQAQRTQTVTIECSPNPAITAGDVVTWQAPRGDIDMRVTAITLPLTPGRMTLTCAADPVLLGQVVP